MLTIAILVTGTAFADCEDGYNVCAAPGGIDPICSGDPPPIDGPCEWANVQELGVEYARHNNIVCHLAEGDLTPGFAGGSTGLAWAHDSQHPFGNSFDDFDVPNLFGTIAGSVEEPIECDSDDCCPGLAVDGYSRSSVYANMNDAAGEPIGTGFVNVELSSCHTSFSQQFITLDFTANTDYTLDCVWMAIPNTVDQGDTQRWSARITDGQGSDLLLTATNAPVGVYSRDNDLLSGYQGPLYTAPLPEEHYYVEFTLTGGPGPVLIDIEQGIMNWAAADLNGDFLFDLDDVCMQQSGLGAIDFNGDSVISQADHDILWTMNDSGVNADPVVLDLNGNGVVDFADILAVISVWGGGADYEEDININGLVDFADILILIANWGDMATDPEPTCEI